MLSFFSNCRNWDSPTPHPQAGECAPLHFGSGGGGAHSLGGDGLGIPIPTRGHTLWYSVFRSTLCLHGTRNTQVPGTATDATESYAAFLSVHTNPIFSLCQVPVSHFCRLYFLVQHRLDKNIMNLVINLDKRQRQFFIEMWLKRLAGIWR